MKRSLKNKRQQARSPAFSDAATAILDVAERLAQTRGYNGFSYADIAAELGVTKASLHYHFPSKEELGRALIERYEAVFAAALDTIDRSADDPRQRLRRYVALYDAVMRNERMCLCGMLAAEHSTLPRAMRVELQRFFDMNERWLGKLLQDGRRSGLFSFREPAGERARMMLAALEGAMLVARPYSDPRRFRVTAGHVLEDLGARGRSV